MQFNITNRYSGKVQFSAEIDCVESTSDSIKLGLAIKVAFKAGADLTGANLANADLANADLTGANLANADLANADLTGANLANIYFGNANLTGAALTRANLANADLANADLANADLIGAKWQNNITLTRALLFITGLRYKVAILDTHMQIGCELHSLADWLNFDDNRIIQMDGKNALKFWRSMKASLLAIAKADGRE